MDLFLIAQIVGVLTTIVAVATFQFKDVRHILLGNAYTFYTFFQIFLRIINRYNYRYKHNF